MVEPGAIPEFLEQTLDSIEELRPQGALGFRGMGLSAWVHSRLEAETLVTARNSGAVFKPKRASRHGLNSRRRAPSSLHGLSRGYSPGGSGGSSTKLEIVTRAAAVTYYALTALVPFLAVLLTVAANLAPDLTGPSGARSPLGGMTVDEFRDELARVCQAPPTRWWPKRSRGFRSIHLLVYCRRASFYASGFASSVTGAVMDALKPDLRCSRDAAPYARLDSDLPRPDRCSRAVIVLATLTVLVDLGRRSLPLLVGRHETTIARHLLRNCCWSGWGFS